MFKPSFLKFGLPAAVLSGVLLSLCFPFWACEFSQIGKTGISALAWVALVPIYLYIMNARGMRAVVGAGIVFGTVAHFLLIYWLMPTMHNYGYIPWPVCVALLLTIAIITSIFMVMVTVLTRFCVRSPWMFLLGSACVWVLVEYFRTYAFTGLPWALFGYTQHTNLLLIQIVDITGVYGVSFMLALFNAAVALLVNLYFQNPDLRRRWYRPAVAGFIIACAVIIGVGVYGKNRISYIENKSSLAPTVEVGLVQASIPQDQKWEPQFQRATMQTYARLTIECAKEEPDIIIWPETAMPFYMPHDQALTGMIMELVNYVGAPVYTGAPRLIVHEKAGGQEYELYNSAFLLLPNMGIASFYDKVHLVPFGEYVPLENVLFFIHKITAEMGAFQRGEAGRVIGLDLPNARELTIGTLICYEGIFPDLARAMARNGANLMVNITNDAWYDLSAGPYQHFIISMFRGIETRTGFVRSANTGITAFVLPSGEIMDMTRLYEVTAVSGAMPLLSETTFYTKFGDFFAKLVSFAAVVLVVMNIIYIRRMKKLLKGI